LWFFLIRHFCKVRDIMLMFVGPCIVNQCQNFFNKMRQCTVFLYFCKLLCMFRVVTPPIIRSTWTCLCYLPPSMIAEGSRDGSIPLIFSWLHTLHFPKFDKCQMLLLQLYVLLMMGGVTTWNMQSSLQKCDKLYIVASC
jgi:hypothetical protein